MAFNIFGPATDNNVRVGYISTDRGYVSNINKCEANNYAKLNPGTTFIFQTRDEIKYLNINEVNSLTANDLVPKTSGDNCTGINLDNPCGPANVFFYGGGGVGVKGNPIIGNDGSLLAVDIVSGGHGYKYPPIVKVKDSCGIGAGSVARAVLGEIVEITEVYDSEDDFEDYELCDPTDVGYGNFYGPNGEFIGDWDPTLYTNLSEDPIRLEIKEYQDFLSQLTKPWWTTRKFAPLRLTSQNKSTRTKFDVDLKDNEFYPEEHWSGFLNDYAISPVPPSNVPGSDFAGIPFTFEWEEDFPYDGEYVFRGLCDNKAEFYLDNIKIADLKGYQDTPEVIKKTIKSGVHKIRLDLLNIPIKEKVAKQVKPPASNEVTFKVSTLADNANSISIPDLGISFSKQRNGEQLKETITKTVEFGKIYSVNISSQGNTRIRLKGNNIVEIEDSEDNDFNDLICSCSQGRFFDVNNNGCKFTVDPPDVPETKSSASQEIKTRNVFNTIDYINKADRQLWRINPTAGKDGDFLSQYGILPFDPGSAAAQTDSFGGTHTIRWYNVNFPIDGNYNIEIMVDDNVTLTFDNQSSQTVIRKEGFSANDRSTGKTLETKFFRSGRYTITAELDQLVGKPLSGGNPMALGVKIETSFFEEEVISAKSWNENPMGVALTIDAPLPPIPQEPVPEQEGRCPRNPLWTTRFPGSVEQWWPVNFSGPSGYEWSTFMNRYAISPVPPLSEDGSDGGGVIYRNSWDVDIPYDGFYAFKSTVDNSGKVLIDGKTILQGDYIRGDGIRRISAVDDIDGGRVFNFREENPEAKKVFLTKGLHVIEVEVENRQTEIYSKIDKKIFNTSDWINSQTGRSNQEGITYSGPDISSYANGTLGPFLTPTFSGDEDYRTNNMGRSWTLTWTNVDFPEDGRYELRAEADDEVIIRVDGTEVGRAKVFEGVRNFNFNATRGKRTIELEIRNKEGIPEDTFQTNPIVFNVIITKKVDAGTGISYPWTTNPVGISAILIPPPCPKKIRGKGVVTDVIITDPGNGYPIPVTNVSTYPATLRIKNVVIQNPGINYSPNNQIVVNANPNIAGAAGVGTPSNGAILQPVFDNFGKVIDVKVLNPGIGFTRYPEITIPSDTGVNAVLIPQFEVVRDPIVSDPETLIQVTDLVGLRQTGYVDGRPYYGAVFYKDGIRYAGFYETAGDLVQVYDTLQESITGEVVTRPSAILRQGSDVSSNDPRLDIPNTPNDLI